MTPQPEGPIYKYVLPIAFATLTLLVSYLIGVSKLENVLGAAALMLTIGVSIFLSEMLLGITSRMEERKAAYSFLSKLLFQGRASPTSSSTNLLTLEEAMALEAAADEVWIYAYDLKWEDGNSTIPDVVLGNLQRGAKYRYIVPNSLDADIRVRSLRARYSAVRDRDKCIEFRKRSNEERIIEFGIAIYNPTIERRQRRNDAECIVILFPHFSGVGPASRGSSSLLAFGGEATIDFQVGYLGMWRSLPAGASAQGDEFDGV